MSLSQDDGKARVTCIRHGSHTVSHHCYVTREAAIPTCKDMSELATDYLEGSLPRGLRLKARLHLMVCRACRHYYEQMHKTARFLAGMRRQAPALDVEQRILSAASAAVRQSGEAR